MRIQTLSLFFNCVFAFSLNLGAMERPPKAIRITSSNEESIPKRSLSQENISYPVSPSSDISGSTSATSSKRKQLTPIRSIKKARGHQSGFSITYYLNNNFELIKNRVRGTVLDLSGLNIWDLDGLSQIPGIANFRHINLSHNIINRISREAFRHLPDLISLELSHNNIEILETDGFANLSSLTNLHLENNRIVYIEQDAFANLNKLKLLSLAGNRLTELRPKMFAGAYSIEELHINDNAIKEIEPRALFSLTFLKKLKLNKNQLEKLTGPMFEGLKFLQELDLRDNKLTEIPTSILAYLPSVHHLLLAGNQIAQVSKQNITALQKAINLKKINLVNNQLTNAQLKKLQAALPHVEITATTVMDVTPEPESTVSKFAAATELSDIAQKLKQEQKQTEQKAIQVLRGIHKSIRDLMNSKNFDFRTYLRSWATDEPYSPITFWYELKHLGLTSLEGLQNFPHIQDIYLIDLSHNFIHTIPAGIFTGLSKLDDIDLRTNQITAIDSLAFANLPNLTQLDLSFNLITQLKPETFLELPKLRSLLFEENAITILPSELFKNLSNLQNLSLGDNQLKQITSENFVGLENLKNLNLRNNKITNLDPAIFSRFKKLKTLNVTGNPLSKENVEAIKAALPKVDIKF